MKGKPEQMCLAPDCRCLAIPGLQLCERHRRKLLDERTEETDAKVLKRRRDYEAWRARKAKEE